MGLFGEIYLFKSPNEVYKPGDPVWGLVKYVVDAPTEVQKITTSLKGTGRIDITEDYNEKDECTYTTDEEYYAVETIIQDKANVVPAGTYEVRFNFNLPKNLPASLYIQKKIDDYKVICSVKYFIHIKFDCPGFSNYNKHFRKEITIFSGVIARLPREPVIFSETKKLKRLFSSKTSNIYIKATILNPSLPIGGKIEVNFEVANNSHVAIKSVDTKLIEGYLFKAKGHGVLKKEEHILPSADVQTFSIQCGDTFNWSLSINVPTSIYSIENPMVSIASRYYLVRLTARLPLPHTNAVLDIPVQIGTVDENPGPSGSGKINEFSYDDPPPSYKQTMDESKNDIVEGSNNEAGNKE